MKKTNTKVLPFEAINSQPVMESEEPKGPRMLPIKKVMELTGLSYSCLRNLCLQDKIVYFQNGKKYLINYDRFVEYLNGVQRA